MGAAVGDYDNDGDADLYVTNYGPNVLYRNEGGWHVFADVTAAATVGDLGWGTHAAFVDYDRDGDLDMYAANYMEFDPAHNEECFAGTVRIYCGPNTYPGQAGVLYRNDGGSRFVDVTTEVGLADDSGRQLGRGVRRFRQRRGCRFVRRQRQAAQLSLPQQRGWNV